MLVPSEAPITAGRLHPGGSCWIPGWILPLGQPDPLPVPPCPLLLAGRPLVKGFLRHTLLIRQTTPWELSGGKLLEPQLRAGLGTEGPGAGGQLAPGDLCPPPVLLHHPAVTGVTLPGSDALWGQWGGWDRGTLARDPGLEGAAIVPPAELAAGEVIRAPW